jgi:Cu+-exporting ATPase
VAGRGVTATAGSHWVQAGSLAWLAETGVDTSAADQVAAELAEAAQTPVAVAVDGRLRLLLGIADALRPDSTHGIARLRRLGLEPVLATGDRRRQPQPRPAPPASTRFTPGCCRRTNPRS